MRSAPRRAVEGAAEGAARGSEEKALRRDAGGTARTAGEAAKEG